MQYCRDYDDDYLGQQITKLYADIYSSAELICHVDSDCVFHQDVTPEALAPGGRPTVYTRARQELPRHWPWTAPTTNFLGWTPELDFMQYPPFTFPRWLYADVRQFCERTKGCTLEQWIQAQPARGFSEFNVMGAFAYRYHPEKFEWVDVAKMRPEAKYCHWFWSWERVSPATRRTVLRDIATA
ncbi:DUF6492 family protein [Marinimicrobium locisalis]|uniref:DUF6492 family protein n=1 Tax=Marinimicrobium locisalis TaxID=546022 RepID=UPI0032216DD4